MITINKSGERLCEPQKLRPRELPDYVCLPNGTKEYLSREQKKDILFGGECPKLCSFKSTYTDPSGTLKSCPDISQISDVTVARNTCNADSNCHFINNSALDRMGPNYCNVKQQDGCITLTEADLALTDKQLTDSEYVCDRLNVGCVFERGNKDGITGPKYKDGPRCLRGCEGTKYWNNPDYIWGGGGTKQDPFSGSYYNSDLKLGPKYLEAAPSDRRPNGWGGPMGSPYFGHGKLPRDLGITYTESRGNNVPPCNLKAGDISVFTSQATGETLAGPGCRLTPPNPRFGLQDWSYTCQCPYLAEGGEFRSDAWRPCNQWELEQDKFSGRNVCKGCWIQNDPKKALYGHCVLGEETPDTESQLLGCIPDPANPDKCRVKRIIEPVECPEFCSKNPSDVTAWSPETQCAESLSKKEWEPNPDFKKIIDLEQRIDGKQAPPYRHGPNYTFKQPKNTDYLCENCSQTPIRTIGTGTDYPNRSYCLIGGSESGSAMDSMNFGKQIARTLTCPPTCKQCATGFFGEPMRPIYKLDQASDPSSAFSKGPIFVPWVGTQAVKELQAESKNFESRVKDFFTNLFKL